MLTTEFRRVEAPLNERNNQILIACELQPPQVANSLKLKNSVKLRVYSAKLCGKKITQWLNPHHS